MLDLYTIKEEFKTLEGLGLTICGDIVNSRVAKSNIQALAEFGCKVYLAGPKEFLPPASSLPKHCEIQSLDRAIEQSDVLMLLRVQHERHGVYEFKTDTYNRDYGLNSERIKLLRPHAIIMHPGPFNRGVEITPELVEHSQSRIFKQKENGVYTRMAILEWIIS